MLTIARDIATYASAALNCKRGATAIEYGLIAAGIAVAIITVVSNLGSYLSTDFGKIATAIKPA